MKDNTGASHLSAQYLESQHSEMGRDAGGEDFKSSGESTGVNCFVGVARPSVSVTPINAAGQPLMTLMTLSVNISPV